MCLALQVLFGVTSAVLSFGGSQSPRNVSFDFVSPSAAESVAVVGGFNNWDRAALPLNLQLDGKTWKGSAEIAPGVYPYLFVLNGNQWIKDPKAPPFPDANGNVNGKLVVTPLDYDASPGKAGDGSITLSPIRHRPDSQDTVRLNETTAYVKLRTRARDVLAVTVLLRSGLGVPMRLSRRDDLYDTWRAEIPVAKGRSTQYRFELNDGPKRIVVGRGDGRSSPGVSPGHSSRLLSQTSSHPAFSQRFDLFPLPKPPAWVQDAVFYQIFPDRFANGDPSNDGPDVQPWGTRPTGRNRMGGDLAGIEQHAGHLKQLGVSGLYLNPVFHANANHAYDTVDYTRVDPRFGTNAELTTLAAELKKQGVRTILDAVFNHSSPDFFAFKDVREMGAASAYANWYFLLAPQVEVKEGQKTYRTFAGVPSMPKLNQDNPATRDYFLKIGTDWIQSAGIGGWRLDVADEVSQEFWRAFRRRIKAADPQAYILGEAWGDAHEYLQGDQHDAVMNYRFRQAVLDFLRSDSPKPATIARDLRQVREDYPDAVLTSMYNLLGSHDTERLRTVLKGDRAKESLAVVLQFCYPGVPSIYYGDEIGMEGGRDPDDRRCMEWDRSKWDMPLFNLYRDLIRLRKERVSLRRGGFRLIAADNGRGLLRFERRSGSERTEIVLNVSPGCRAISLMRGDCRVLLESGLTSVDKQAALGPNGFVIFGNR